MQVQKSEIENILQRFVVNRLKRFAELQIDGNFVVFVAFRQVIKSFLELRFYGLYEQLQKLLHAPYIGFPHR